jgi:hypothetical protein
MFLPLKYKPSRIHFVPRNPTWTRALIILNILYVEESLREIIFVVENT